LTAVSIGGFLLGVLVAAPRKKKQIIDHDRSAGAMDDTHDNRTRPNTLSDEDRDYIN